MGKYGSNRIFWETRFDPIYCGKYAERAKQGSNIVLLDPDVAKEFPDAAAVNDALRKYLRDKKNSPGKAT